MEPYTDERVKAASLYASSKPTWLMAQFDRIRKDYLATGFDVVVTGTVLLVAGSLTVIFVNWGVVHATWSASNLASCQKSGGACWSVIAIRYRIILFGLYPYDQQWRAVVGCVTVLLTVAGACTPTFWTARRMLVVWAVGYTVFFLIVRGGAFGLSEVPPNNWGGLTLTLFVYISTIALGLPLATVIALVNESESRVLRPMTILVVDLTRSLPLITILLSAVIILPFVVSSSFMGDKIYRIIAGFVLFFASYQSENIRAGLQSVSSGQIEAGRSLGLHYWQIVSRITLPQAFRSAMPATINQFVVTFKETSLVAIVGLFDLMASAQAAYNTGELQSYYKEVLIFVALIYFIGSFSLSRYGMFLERRMSAQP